MTAPLPGPAQEVVGQDVAAQAVADVLRSLEDLPGRPLAEHVAVFDGVHRALQGALARLDEA